MGKNIHHANNIQNKAMVNILISDKVNFKTTNFIRYKKINYIMIKIYELNKELKHS